MSGSHWEVYEKKMNIIFCAQIFVKYSSVMQLEINWKGRVKKLVWCNHNLGHLYLILEYNVIWYTCLEKLIKKC